MNQITRKAYAKINLGLDVLRRRPDGYHELRMIMQTVDICDDLTFTRTDRPGVTLSTDCSELPTDGSNLICRAASLLLEQKGIDAGVEITLVKRIPIAAGMAGGSADAAAAMHGLNELFALGCSLRELQEAGVRLGADIPYCLAGGTMLAEGIGDVLTPLPEPPQCHLVVAKPDINVSTAFVYGNLHADTLTEHPDIDGMAQALREGSLRGVTERMGNVLETVTAREYPVIEEIKALMRTKGAENALMSGSGPTVFGIFRQKDTAEAAAGAIADRQLAGQIFVTAFCGGA